MTLVCKLRECFMLKMNFSRLRLFNKTIYHKQVEKLNFELSFVAFLKSMDYNLFKQFFRVLKISTDNALRARTKINSHFGISSSSHFWHILKTKNLVTGYYYCAFCSLKSMGRLSENSNFFQNQGLLKKLPQAYS